MDVFKVGERAFSRREVLAAADLRGELEPIRRDIADGIIALAHAEAQGLEHEELQSVVNAYRRDHGLITAEETETYLNALDLSIDDLCSVLIREHWRRIYDVELPELRQARLSANDDSFETLWSNVVFSDALGPVARRLAERIALSLHLDADATSELTAGELDAELARFGVSRQDMLERFERFGCGPSWLDELIGLEILHGREVEKLITPRRCEQTLVAQRLSLTRVEVEVGFFASPDAAREAFLCVTQDGDDFADVLELAGAEGDRLVMFIDDLPGAVSQPLLSAMEGETLAPLELEGSHVLCRLARKVTPVLDDPVVRARLEEAILDSQLGALVDAHVTWLLPGVQG